MKKIAMIGVGKLGQDCAEVMTEHGYNVVGFDVIPRFPKFPMTDSIRSAVIDRDIIFIAAPTPHDIEYGGETPTSHLPAKDFDYSIVIDILKEVNEHVNQQQLVVLISTVLPGTVRNILKPNITNARFLYNPYLIAMGTVKWDMVNPEMIIIGTEDGSITGEAGELVDFYKTFMENNPRYEIGTWDEAESIKIFYNTFISTKLALVNMIQDVAEGNGNINVDVVTNALKNSNKRIMGPSYMTAGMGDAGACHPRDNIALRYLAEKLDLGYDLFDAIMKAREVQTEKMAKKCLANGKNITIIGKAYKPGVAYTNGSTSLLLGYYIESLGGNVNYFDPNTGDIDLKPDWTEVYFISYWDEYVEHLRYPSWTTVIDPWRKIEYYHHQGEIIHYGDTRPKKKIRYSAEFIRDIRKAFFSVFPDLKQYEEKIYVTYGSSAYEFDFCRRSFKDIVDEINQAIKDGQNKIVFFNNSETLLTNILYKAQRIVNYFKDQKENTFFLTNSGFDSEKSYYEVCINNKWEPKLKILTASAFEYITKDNNKVKEVEYKTNLKNKKFVCFNRIHRRHRIILFSKLFDKNLIKQGYYSFEGGEPNWIDTVNWDFFDNRIKKNIVKNKKLFPIKLNISSERQNPVDIIEEDLKYHNDSYFSIVTETIFSSIDTSHYDLTYKSYKFFSEKIFRPILLKHPFILVAWPGALKKLRELGYKTFFPYINESYDQEFNDEIRMEMLVNEIEKLCNFTDSQWINFQNNVKPIVEHNYKVIMEKRDYNCTPNLDFMFKD